MRVNRQFLISIIALLLMLLISFSVTRGETIEKVPVSVYNETNNVQKYVIYKIVESLPVLIVRGSVLQGETVLAVNLPPGTYFIEWQGTKSTRIQHGKFKIIEEMATVLLTITPHRYTL